MNVMNKRISASGVCSCICIVYVVRGILLLLPITCYRLLLQQNNRKTTEPVFDVILWKVGLGDPINLRCRLFEELIESMGGGGVMHF